VVAEVANTLNLEEVVGVTMKMLEKITRDGHTEAALYLPESIPRQMAEKLVEVCLAKSLLQWRSLLYYMEHRCGVALL
jgi:hypothetical protein